MVPHSEALKRYCSRAMTAAVLIGAALIFGGLALWGKGLIAGALFSILNFVLMAEILPHHIGKTRRHAAAFSLGSILLRYTLMTVPMILALKYHLFHPAAAGIGLFFVQIVILTEHLISSITSSPGRRA